MARPKTNTVDYFPHVAKTGKTIYVLEARFGNDGYAAWFKLLELLASSHNHYIDCEKSTDWHYLVSRLKMPEVSVTEILDLLAELGNIDAELWNNGRLIWCEAFVENIADVYKKRKRDVPTRPKPRFCNENTNTADVSVTETRQSKVKESKVKESTDSGESSATNSPSPAEVARHFFDAYADPSLRDDDYFDFAARLGEVEIDPFVSYWTEPTKSGRKVLWETKPTWELGRRIATWMRNADKRASRNGTSANGAHHSGISAAEERAREERRKAAARRRAQEDAARDAEKERDLQRRADALAAYAEMSAAEKIAVDEKAREHMAEANPLFFGRMMAAEKAGEDFTAGIKIALEESRVAVISKLRRGAK